MFDDDVMKDGEKHLTLGPAYFEARKIAERVMAKFEDEHFKPLVDKITNKINEEVWSAIQSGLLSDTEMNLQNEMWIMVDSCVEALLGGRKWALQKYALSDRYDIDDIRAAVAKHIPAELQDKRIADLEAEVKRLREDNAWLRR